MALQVVGNVTRLSVFGNAAGQAVMNTHWYAALAPQFVGSDQADGTLAFLTAFRSLWRLNALPLLNTGYTVSEYRADVFSFRFLNSPPPPAFRLNTVDIQILNGAGAADTGTSVGTPTPTFESFGISYTAAPQQWRTKSGNRIGPPVEEATNLNTLNALVLGAVQSLATNLAAPLVANNGTDALARVVFSMKRATTLADPQTWPTSFISRVTSSRVNTFITTQVSRKQRLAGPG